MKMYPSFAFVGYNIPLQNKNCKRFFKIFAQNYAGNRIFVETHKFYGKFPAN